MLNFRHGILYCEGNQTPCVGAADEQDAQDHQRREGHRAQDAQTQIIAESARNRAASVGPPEQPRSPASAIRANIAVPPPRRGRRRGERARPEYAYCKAAQPHADKTQHGRIGQADEQIGKQRTAAPKPSSPC